LQNSIKKTLKAFLLFNGIILILWVWARDGSVVHLSMVVENETHSLYCNGQLIDTFVVPEHRGLPSGMPGLGLSKDTRPPLVVKPQEFFNFFVTDIETGDILWGDDHRKTDWDWHMMRGSFIVTDRNRLRSNRHAHGAVGDSDWSNYRIDVSYGNPTEGIIFFRVNDSKNYGEARLRYWRELVVSYAYYIDGERTFHRLKRIAEPFDQGIQSLVLRFVKVYAVGVLILTGFLAIFLIISFIVHIIQRLHKKDMLS
jgi:hypothetical protein